MATKKTASKKTASKKTASKKTAKKAKVTKLPAGKASGIKTTADVKNPRRGKKVAAKKASKKTASKKTAKKATKRTAKKNVSFTDSSVIVVEATPSMTARAKLAELVSNKGTKVSQLVKKAIEAGIKTKGETTEAFVLRNIQGGLNAGKFAIKK